LMIADTSDPKPHNMLWTLIVNRVLTQVSSMIKKVIPHRK